MTQNPIPQIHQIASAGAKVRVLRSLITRNLRIESALPGGFRRTSSAAVPATRAAFVNFL
jgi:hypothetical protein